MQDCSCSPIRSCLHPLLFPDIFRSATMLRFHLPPNLASAAPRDAIAVKVDLDLSSGPPPAEYIPALVLLQRWSGAQTPPKIIQLNRLRLRELLGTLKGQPVFFWVNG